MKRQHPFAFIHYGFQFIRGTIFLFIILSFNDFRNGEYLYPILFILGLIVLGMIIGWVRWYFLQYDMDEEQFYIYQGVFAKKYETYPHIKISGVNYSSNRILELLGLTTIAIETAGKSEDSSAKLFLKESDAKVIEENIVYYAKKQGNAEVSEEDKPRKEEPDFKLPWGYLFVMSATSRMMFVVLTVITSSISQVMDTFGEFLIQFPLFAGVNKLDLGEIIVTKPLLFISWIGIAALISWVTGTIITALRYANYRVIRDQDTLHIAYGLWSTKNVALEVNRIQAIRIREGVLRGWLGFHSVEFDSIGYDGDEYTQKALLLPLVRKQRTWSLIERLVPEYYVQPRFVHSPKRARIRFYFRGVIAPTILCMGAGFLWNPIWWLLLVTPLLAYLSELRYRDNGIQTVDGKMVTSSRLLEREIVVIPWPGLQSILRTQSILQLWRNLATYEIAVATDQLELVYKARELDPDLYAELTAFLQQRKEMELD
ncbi:PH domain-containing protein [Pontibacillus salicampi]|uniref:PH domain-containing protein n=1 Tax=Pontibacillus salicampi TaxID=1449801 RepID=A0ABV6LM81_9BACI